MKTEHHPKDAKSNWKGANVDIDPELSGADNDGEYYDSKNGRISDSTGGKRSHVKIRGEEVEFPAQNIPGDWVCIGEKDINKNIVEIWVDRNGAEAPIIRIDGVIMGQSPDMPWLVDFPIQCDRNENCKGGEWYITDNNTTPMIFNIQDIIDSLTLDPDKYFTNFNPALYTVNLDAPLDIPVFTGLENVGGGGGLPIGSYQYSLRYVNDEGDRTNWGHQTPPIPVLQGSGTGSNQYPYTKSYGDSPDVTAPTSFGIKLKFRITNLVNYDFIEIRRVSYQAAGGLDFVPQGEVIAKLEVSPGEISVREFVDPIQSNVEDTLADGEGESELSFIEKAKAIRYHDKKIVLMNYSTASKETNLVFDEFNGKKIFPIVQKLGKAGHNDPVNHTYYKNYTGGERFSFAVNLFDALGGRGFAEDDAGIQNFQIPNRRAEADADSQLLSYFGTAEAANLQSAVTQTHEIFDLEDAVSKTDKCGFQNILDDGSKSQGKVNSLGCPDSGHGLFVGGDEIGYDPYRPTDQNDSTGDHNYQVNFEADAGPVTRAYNPEGFAPNYYAHGVAIGGISNLPSWAKAFSVVRTAPAGRVVCQGIGSYALNQGDFNAAGNASAATKDQDKFWFFSPDIEAGIISQSVIDDISSNPQNYSVQVVSPLGFFSEVYSFEENSLLSARDRLVDMITYARVLHDEGQINPGEDPGMGVGSGGNRYVAYNKYRNSHAAGGGAFVGPDGGDTLISIDSIASVTEGRGVYYELSLAGNVYNAGGSGGTGNNDFDDAGLKDFTEPMYIINIVQDGKNVIDQNIDQYYGTGHYQKVESIIGQADGTPDQFFELVDERWEDCIPDLSSTGPRAADEVFVYLQDGAGNIEVFMDSTFLTAAQVTAILTDITTNGFYAAALGNEVVGLYTHTNAGDTAFTVEFNVPNFYPTVDQKILVRYDNRRPIRVFGGDSTVGEAIFSPIDREADASDNAEDTQFVFNIGFPFRKYEINPRQYIVARTTGINKIQDINKGSLGYIRQLCIMFACESRVAVHYAHNGATSDQYFPLTHYIMRPNRFDNSSFATGVIEDIASDNNMFEDYFEDYPLEYSIWKFGGLRFMQNINLDYAVRGPIEFLSKPDFGFEEENDFCTGVTWSLSRAINQQDSPGLKTFLSLNRFDLDDDDGEIKKAWDATTPGKGDNLYAICESGICLILTNKTILSSLEANDLSTLASDRFVGGQYWLDHEVGSSDEMWRGMGEGTMDIITEDGRVKQEALYIPNNHSVYRLMSNVVKDIAKDTYFSRLNPVLIRMRVGYLDRIAGGVNHNHNEYWLQLDPQRLPEFLVEGETERDSVDSETFVFAQDTNHWLGSFDYKFDTYLFSDNDMYGFRGLETYKLERGFEINGGPIEYSLITNYSPSPAVEKEYIRFEVMTGKRGEQKPSRIEFLDEDRDLVCALDPGIQGPLYLKQYDGWGQQIPRKDLSVSATRDRVQARLLFCKVIHIFEEDFKVVETVLQYKPIK